MFSPILVEWKTFFCKENYCYMNVLSTHCQYFGEYLQYHNSLNSFLNIALVSLLVCYTILLLFYNTFQGSINVQPKLLPLTNKFAQVARALHTHCPTCKWWDNNADSKVHGTNMGATWVLSAPDGPHVGPMNLAIRESSKAFTC